jgi:7-cyano-7-deazaguanine synthase
MKRAVCLLSGGLDSTVAAHVAREEGYALYALTVDYGQRHRVELESARKVAKSLGVEKHVVIELNLRAFGGSALTDEIEVPRARTLEEMGKGIPVTYVPARNTIFLSICLGWAEALKAEAIFIGVNALDYSGYPDCRPEFIKAFEELARLATKAADGETTAVSIRAPLIQKTKKEIVQLGRSLGADFSLTHSCYSPDDSGVSCGGCDSCQLRLLGFREAGLEDPIAYAGH